MAVKLYQTVVTLTGGVPEQLPSSPSGGLRWVSFQPGAANANPIFMGGSSVSSTTYGVRLPSADGGVPPAPYIIGEFNDGSIALSDFYVFGTAGEKLHILYLVVPVI